MKYYLLISLCIFVLFSCSPNKQREVLFVQADSLLNSNPDSALILLKTLPDLQEGLNILEKYPEEIITRRHTLRLLGDLYFDSRHYKEAIKMYQDLYNCSATDVDKSIALTGISGYYCMTNQERAIQRTPPNEICHHLLFTQLFSHHHILSISHNQEKEVPTSFSTDVEQNSKKAIRPATKNGRKSSYRLFPAK